ncbi:MAG: ribonuclease H, partial [Arenicellales bacterium]
MTELADQKALTLFTDGACRGNPGPGGWGVLIRDGSQETELLGSERHTTNNRMELVAAIRALEAVSPEHPVAVYTDSQYVRNGVTQWIS